MCLQKYYIIFGGTIYGFLYFCDFYLADPRVALGAGLGVWGVINLLEGYGNDNPGANAHVR